MRSPKVPIWVALPVIVSVAAVAVLISNARANEATKPKPTVWTQDDCMRCHGMKTPPHGKNWKPGKNHGIPTDGRSYALPTK